MATARPDGRWLSASDEDRMIALLRDVQGADAPPSVAEILRILETTTSFRLRNAAALALVDLGAPSAAACIGSVLTRPEVAPQCGTLLYALDELAGTLPVEGLVTIMRHGSFEARSEALGLAEEGRVASDDGTAYRRAIGELMAMAAGSDAEAAEAARDALALLSHPGAEHTPVEHHR